MIRGTPPLRREDCKTNGKAGTRVVPPTPRLRSSRSDIHHGAEAEKGDSTVISVFPHLALMHHYCPVEGARSNTMQSLKHTFIRQ